MELLSDVSEHIFRTKTGACMITRERILLTREGARGAAADRIYGNSMGRTRLIYGSLGLASLAFGVWSLVNGETIAGVFLCVFGIVFLRNIAASRNISVAPIIDLSAIRTVEAHPPRPPATRGYFVVWFEKNGKERKRLIALPGIMENGQDEYARAEAAMRDAGLISPTPS